MVPKIGVIIGIFAILFLSGCSTKQQTESTNEVKEVVKYKIIHESKSGYRSPEVYNPYIPTLEEK